MRCVANTLAFIAFRLKAFVGPGMKDSFIPRYFLPIKFHSTKGIKWCYTESGHLWSPLVIGDLVNLLITNQTYDVHYFFNPFSIYPITSICQASAKG